MAKGNARNVSLKTLYRGNILSHRRNNTVSLETYPLYSFPQFKNAV